MIKQLASKLKKKINIYLGHTSAIREEINCRKEWYGSLYGGFYIHPDIVKSSSVVYSFGIGEDISFDQKIIEKHGCNVFGFDPTPKSIKWINDNNLPSNFTFLNYGIDVESGMVEFHLPKNSNHVSGSVTSHRNVDDSNIITVPMKSFSDITASLKHSHIDVLKMDIEGSEYNVLKSILASPVMVDQILVEIHERFFDDGKEKTKLLLDTLHEAGYKIFAVSNTMEEISFIRSALILTH